MANVMTKKQYDQVKNENYTVKVFDMETGMQVRYLQAVSLTEAFDFMIEWQKVGFYSIMERHWVMLNSYMMDGTILTDLKMVLILSRYFAEREYGDDTAPVNEREKLEVLKENQYVFRDAYTMGLHKKYNGEVNENA